MFHAYPVGSGHWVKRLATKLSVFLTLLVLAGCEHEKATVRTGEMAPPEPPPADPGPARPSAASLVKAEELRTDCINNRRLICGRVVKMDPDGLVVESGYKDLLREPLTHSWVVPGTAVASRDPSVLELNQPGTPCIGLVFLTDIPKKPKVKDYDYVIIMGYPAGEYAYAPVPNVEKTIRKFSAGLDTAVRLRLQGKDGSN